jgi:iron complex outermembrane receptor protein
LSLTADAYRIDITNRVALSETLTAANVQTFLANQGFTGIGAARFFINGVDTKTKGVDVVTHYALPFEAAGKFDFTLTANFNDTDVTRVPKTNALSQLNPAPVLFARVNVLTYEQGAPRNKFGFQSNWQLARVGATLRLTRYGSWMQPGPTAATDAHAGTATLVDLEGRVNLTESLRLDVGADNLFDQYPDPFPAALDPNGNAPFSNYSPFGRSGRFVYGRLSYDFK